MLSSQVRRPDHQQGSLAKPTLLFYWHLPATSSYILVDQPTVVLLIHTSSLLLHPLQPALLLAGPPRVETRAAECVSE